MKNFINKNSKWIVRIFIILWIYLIYKLFSISMYTTCWWWGWYINMCIVPDIHYEWINSSIISVIFFVLSLWIIYIIRKEKDKTKKVILAFLILLMWLIWKQIFYIVSPDFKFYFTDENLIYMDKDFHPKNVDLYLEYMWKYCNDNMDNFSYKKLQRSSMCWWKYLYDFETVEDYKKVFDYANKNNMRELYRVTFIWAQDFWLEKIIKGYNNDTFYGYVIKKNWADIKTILLMSKITKNKNLINIFNYINLEYLKWNKIIFNDFFKEREYWEIIENKIDNKLEKIKIINTKVF